MVAASGGEHLSFTEPGIRMSQPIEQLHAWAHHCWLPPCCHKSGKTYVALQSTVDMVLRWLAGLLNTRENHTTRTYAATANQQLPAWTHHIKLPAFGNLAIKIDPWACS